jgi:Zn-dependent protease with chaperone function
MKSGRKEAPRRPSSWTWKASMSGSETTSWPTAAGFLFERGRSAARPATLHRTMTGEVAISPADGGRGFSEADILDISNRLGTIPRRLTLIGGSVFETRDNDAVDSLLAGRLGRASALLHRAEAFRVHLIGVAAVVLLSLWLAVTYGLPAAANIAARVTPPAIVSLIDRGVLQSAEFAILQPSALAEARQGRIRAAFDGLASQSALPAANYRLVFRRSDVIGPNAFALPGGTIVLTDALVALARSDAEILGVLAHEIAHVEERHGLRQLYRALGLSVMISLVGADSGEIVDEVVGQAGLLLSLSYSRRFEAAADRRAIDLMRAARHDPEALASMLERLLTDCPACGARSWYGTHPAVGDRIEAIRDAARN